MTDTIEQHQADQLEADQLEAGEIEAQIGAYAALCRSATASAAELAEVAAIAPRCAREWLEQQAAAGWIFLIGETGQCSVRGCDPMLGCRSGMIGTGLRQMVRDLPHGGLDRRRAACDGDRR